MNPTDPILIAYLPTPRDLEIARTEGWYRIPEKHVPQALGEAGALAFYQGANFGKKRWRIEYWAPIRRRVETTRIALLPDEPDHPRANEAYVKVILEPVRRLHRPLTSDRGRRLLFKSTLWGRLVHADSLDHLFDRRPVADDPLYRILKSQLDDDTFDVADPDTPHQRRLLERRTVIWRGEATGRKYGAGDENPSCVIRHASSVYVIGVTDDCLLTTGIFTGGRDAHCSSK